MLGLVRAQAQPAPKPVEKEHAQRPAKDIGQGMKKGTEHDGGPVVGRVRGYAVPKHGTLLGAPPAAPHVPPHTSVLGVGRRGLWLAREVTRRAQ